MQASKRHFAPFIIYLVVFHSAWLGYVLWIYPLVKSLGDATFRFALVNITIRLLVWVFPIFLYLHYIDHIDPFEYLKLKQNWKQGVVIGLVLSMLIFLGSLVHSGLPHLSMPSLSWNGLLSTSLLIGFFEEIPYRGFILQKFEERHGFWLANLVSSILFLGIHLPGWISLHLLNVTNLIFVFIFGIVMAIVFKVGRSLWGPIVAHSLNDFISSVLFGL